MKVQSRFTGFCQQVKEGIFVGWAINVAIPNQHVTISVRIDEKKVAEIESNQDREDIQKQLNFLRSDIGFQFIIPEQFRDGKPHELSFSFPNGDVVSVVDMKDRNKKLTSLTFTLIKEHQKAQYISCLDGWKNGAINGWVLKKDPYTGQYVGNCKVKVLLNGVELKTVLANGYRGDVASASGGDAYCGFSVVVPVTLRKRYQATFRIVVLPEEIDIQGSPYQTTLINDLLEQQLITINNRVESLYKEISGLRKELQKLIIQPRYVLEEYAVWAKKYFSYLPARLEYLQKEIKKRNITFQQPVISIICPVYKPQIKFFKEAVQSVLNQTYQNWELLLVDDGGGSIEIQNEIKQFVKQDERVKSIFLKKNKGIAEATNAGIKKAVGEWIAFFDHDDVLVAEALEIMLCCAQLNQAQVVYSDEDKLDQDGHYIAPHLKPDFNYRYLLGINYICHFLVVRADIIKQAGFFKSIYNGAQDHDFLLRLTEIVPHRLIYHVPEILYHWRMTRYSTAETTEHKQYAVDAGIACVSDHLKRVKKAALVTSVDGSAAYQIIWNKKQQHSVTIIIPFKDQVKITKECVDRLLENTSYKNYRILLVDNGSYEAKTLAFLSEYAKVDKIEVLRIDEEFNFSRLNNLATQQVGSDFYVFLNNDVFVDDADWLSILVNEAALFDDVGVVGAKLLYPNEKVQHAGVIVTPGLVAEHMGKGLSKNDPGYVKRSILSQELTAVTAAMMLVKASVFHQINGFNEVSLKIAFNDVDLCLRVREAGYKVVLAANCIAVHHESLSRGSDDHPEHNERFYREIQYMNDTWGGTEIYQNDPAYPPLFVASLPFFYQLKDPDKTVGEN